MSVLDAILGFFSAGGSPEKKQLREVRKYLKNNKAGFIKVGSNMLQPNMAKFFYTVYYFSASYSKIVERMRKSEMIFSIVFEECLNEKQKARFMTLNPQQLEVRSKEVPIDQLKQEAYNSYNALLGELKAQDLRRINETYSMFKVFEELVSFDYHPPLRLFDPALPEKDFKYKPKFVPVEGEKVLPFLKNFSEMLNVIAFVPHWEQVFSTVKIYNRGEDPVKPAVWQKVIKDLANLKKSGLIEAIIHHLDDNMSFVPRSVLRVENLASKYMDSYKDNMESFFYRLQQQEEKKEIDRLMSRIFSAEELARVATYKMRNYSEDISARVYSKVGMGYKYSTALWYLKAFVIENLKTEFRDVVNTMVVKGQWRTSQFSRDLSDALHNCMTLSEDIVHFDDMLAEGNPYGKRIFVLVHRIAKDRSAGDMLKQTLEDVNSKAYAILKKTRSQLVSLSTLLSEVEEDYSKDMNNRELLLNWRELDSEIQPSTGLPMGKALNRISEKLAFFMEFLSLYVS
jgi:hypothetical protein